MTHDQIHLSGADLSHLEQIAIVQDENTYLYDVIGFSAELGLFSAKMSTIRLDLDLEDLAFEMDALAGEARGSIQELSAILGARAVAIPLDPLLFVDHFVADGTQVPEGFPEDQVALLRRVATSSLPERSAALLRRFRTMGTTKLMDALNFLSSGDQTARRQAVEAYPLAANALLANVEFRRVIDAREELGPAIADQFALTASQMRIYSRIEQAYSRLALSPDNPAGTDGLMTGHVWGGIHQRSPGMHKACELARAASQTLRLDQLPSGTTPDDDRDSLRPLYALEISQRAQQVTSLGPEPFDRVLTRVRAGDWTDACARLEAQCRKISNLSDYARNTIRALNAAILVNEIRDGGAVDLDGLSRAAHKVLADDPIDRREAEDLSVFLSVVNERAYQLSQRSAGFLALLGRNASLKEISELNQRWHHIQGRISNQLMASSHDLSWTPLIGEISLGGQVLREVSSTAEMIRQGEIERHCVGSYAQQVLQPNPNKVSLIFSIEEPGGKTLSTAEIVRHRVAAPGGGFDFRWECPQNLARGNTPPPRDAVAAAELLLSHLQAMRVEDVENYVSEVCRQPGNLKGQLVRAINAVGANICDPDLPERTLASITSTLPKALRGLSLQELSNRLTEAEGPLSLGSPSNMIERIERAFRERSPSVSPQCS